MKNRLKEIRTLKGKTQKEIAGMLGISEAGYSYYEKGTRKPKLETWKELSEFFNVPVQYLQGFGWSQKEVITFFVKSIIDDGKVYKFGYDFSNLKNMSPSKIFEKFVKPDDKERLETSKYNYDDLLRYTKKKVQNDFILVDELLKDIAMHSFNDVAKSFLVYVSDLNEDESNIDYEQYIAEVDELVKETAGKFVKELDLLSDYNFLCSIGENSVNTGITSEYEIALKLRQEKASKLGNGELSVLLQALQQSKELIEKDKSSEALAKLNEVQNLISLLYD